jgi:adenylosuccinate lyase
VDEILKSVRRIVDDLRINDQVVARNLEVYGVFAATERVLMEAVRRGADRQEMHEVIREHSLAAWEDIQTGQINSLFLRLSEDKRVGRFLTQEHVLALLDASTYTGDAAERARSLAAALRALDGTG